MFREYATPLGIPVAYMQALACRESTCNPLDREGDAWGLMQITEVVRCDEPREDGKPGRYEREELFDPRISVFLCTRVLAKTVRVLNMVGIKTDWRDPVWVGLVTAGWNAGYSLKSGVGLVVRYLKARGWKVKDIDNKVIHENAKKAGASYWLWAEAGRLEWWETVVRMYFKISKEQGAMR